MNLLKTHPIPKIQSSTTPPNGSGNTTIINCQSKTYIAKTSQRPDFITIYNKVQHHLNQKGILQAKIIKTKTGELITPEGLVLYEFLEGDSIKNINKTQLQNAIKYMKTYNQALQTVPFESEEIESRNHWDQARSLEFIIEELPTYLEKSDIDNDNKKTIYDGINILSSNKEKLLKEKMQLIHADLGADNFMFKGDEVVSIIDFTPEYNHELYSLAQFIYWNYLWDNPNINMEEINSFLEVYNSNETNPKPSNSQKELLYILLIRASIFRIVGPLVESVKLYNKTNKNLLNRFLILNKLIDLQ